MSNFFTPAAAYLNRRNELLAERAVAQSPVVIQKINKALLASEISMATFHELDSLNTLQQRKARLIDWHEPESQHELQNFALLSNQLSLPAEVNEQSYLSYQHDFNALVAVFPWQYASLQMVQNDLFSTTFNLWLEILEELFGGQNRKMLFIRLEKVLAFTMSKIPVLGEAIDTYRQLTLVMTTSHEKASNSADYFRTLESYTELAYLCCRGILIFCFTAEAVLRGRKLPSQTMLSDKIKSHCDGVTDSTHPYF